MSMRFVTVKVTRDPLHSSSNEYAPWEVPILETIHEPGNVTETDSRVVEDRELPDAKEEWDRLENRYGRDTESGVSYLVQTYGQGRVGFAALKTMIDNERAANARPAKADADDLAA